MTVNLAIATHTEIDRLIVANAPVAIGVSGGKDSQAAALATIQHLDAHGHQGPRVLIHSDLGSVEWHDSLPVCQQLADHLCIPLIRVARKAGGLCERWATRWQSSVRRYEQLQTVTLVLPWSTPSMRFCTSELKTHVIGAELRRRFKGRIFINVTGVRREESLARSRSPAANLESDGKAWSWRPICDWTTAEVFARIDASGLAPHPAYRTHGMSRVSCRFCIMSSGADLLAATRVPESHDLFRSLVDLEIASSFGFQGQRWLADVAPYLLTEAQRDGVRASKERAVQRISIEAAVTPAMRYARGWPQRRLIDDEAVILAEVRQRISALYGFTATCLDVASIHARYDDLMTALARRQAA